MNTPAKPGTAQAALEGVQELGRALRGEDEEAETAVVVATEGQPIALDTGWSPSQVQLVKDTIAKASDLTDDEFRLFIATCQRMKLDPLARQIHAVKRYDTNKGRKVMSIQIAIDGFRKIADDSGNYAGNSDPVYEKHSAADNKAWADYPKKATVTVHKIVAEEARPFTRSARWAEYYPGEKQGFFWRKMPFVMLGKCAEALALRVAFPAELGGMYIPEEMDQAGEVASPRAQTKAPDDDTPKAAAFVPPTGSMDAKRSFAALVVVPFGNEGTKGKKLGDLSQAHVDRLADWVRAREDDFAERHAEFVWAIEEMRSKTEEELEARRVDGVDTGTGEVRGGHLDAETGLSSSAPKREPGEEEDFLPPEPPEGSQ